MSHLTAAVSENAFEQLFALVRDNFKYSTSDSKNFGPFSVGYSVALHLSGGSITLNNDNTVEIQNVDIDWDSLQAQICLNLPQLCVGGWCIVPDPFDGCWVSVPKWCIGGPICIGPDLSGILVSRIHDVKARLTCKYVIDPLHTSTESDLEAELNGHPNKWKVFIDPVWVHVDPIDVGATADNLIEKLVNDAIDAILGPAPGFIKDLIKAIIGPVLGFIKAILGIATSIQDWLSDLFNHQFDLLGLLETAIAQYFAAKYPLYEWPDPYPILPAGAGLIPVAIPIRNVACTVNSAEMVLQADVG
jgi:hypothetical protein